MRTGRPIPTLAMTEEQRCTLENWARRLEIRARRPPHRCVAVLTVVFGLALAAYLVYIQALH
jgi:hypothetical protein